MKGAGKVRVRTKLAYGVGAMADGVKTTGFVFFLLFYYTQVLGLSGALTGLAMLIALVFDAITDPLVGSLSDALRHKWGRRHPLMYLSALPLAVAFALVFTPPAGLSQLGLFAWLTTFAVLTRGAMSLFSVPHHALGAELSEDYQERTSVVAYRTFFAYIGAVVIIAGGFAAFFKPTAEYENGQLNPDAYAAFGVAFAVVMVITILVCTLGTHGTIASLPKPADNQRFGLRAMFRDMAGALRNTSFRMFFIGLVIYFVSRGTGEALGLHMGTYFWELPTQEVQFLPLSAMAGVLVGVPVWLVASRRIDKKPMFLTGIIMFSVLTAVMPIAKIVGFYPPQSSPAYLSILLSVWFCSGLAGAAALVPAGSMIADITDEHELTTSLRQEGIFFGALAFAAKAASGLGSWFAGLSLDVMDFPLKALPGEVSEAKLTALGLVAGPGVAIVAAVSFLFLARYQITKSRHREIRAELDRRAAAATSP